MLLENLRSLAPTHLAALLWFQERAGQEVSWPKPLDGVFLANKAKGIHKPQGWNHALSVRQALGGPYEDALHWAPDGSWSFNYHHEGNDPLYFTNRAMNACRTDKIPVGVLLQVKQKPNPTYKVLGLGLVTDDSKGVFTLRQYGSPAEKAETAVAIQFASHSFDASNLVDARLRAMKAIAIRRGQPAFRSSLLRAYAGACCVSGCTTSAVLEAAHILPYRGDHTNHVTNGLLLRADLHTLFDLGLLSITPSSYAIVVADELRNTEYFELHGARLRLPDDIQCWPDDGALRSRYALTTEAGA